MIKLNMIQDVHDVQNLQNMHNPIFHMEKDAQVAQNMHSPTVHSPIKLLKHLDRLNTWYQTGHSYPIMIDMDLTNVCNNKCPLCCGTMGRETIPIDFLRKLIPELKELGVKSFGLGGGGDPTCHPNVAEVIRLIKANEMEVGMYTNGFVVSDDVMDAIVNCCTWIRVSLDADGPEIYKKTHGMDGDAFYKVTDNIKSLVSLRNRLKSNTAIGTCYLVGPHTFRGVYGAAKLSKELGVDSLRFRPFFDWGDKKSYTEEEAKAMVEELDRCLDFQDDSFSVSYPKHRTDRMVNSNLKRAYEKCNVTKFITSITADLKLYPCCHLKNNKKYAYGDLTKQSFKEIWLSDTREGFGDNYDLRDCPNPCQLDVHNKLLWNIKQPIPHSNFL